jgi:two-component system, sensor histidine kinase
MVSQYPSRDLHPSRDPHFGWADYQTTTQRMNARNRGNSDFTRHVLIVEDCAHDVEMVRYSLLSDPQNRYVFAEANTLALARQMLETDRHFDIVVMDWRLPDGMADVLIKHLTCEDEIPRVPIVLLTASDEKDIHPEILRSGIQDYFTKDCLLPGVLPRIVSNAIDRFRLLKELSAQRRAARESQEKAEEANRAKSAFLTGMSHELRTPLTAIVGLADLMMDDPASRDAPQMLEMIRNNGQHLTQLLGDLLDLAKIELGRTSVTKSDCSIVEVTRDLCNLMRHRASDDGLQLHLHVEPGFNKIVRTDQVRYRQILLNLISNSIKYTSTGHIDVILRSMPEDEGWFEAEVRDTGRGIPPEIQNKLFLPFVQGDSQNAGVGLGLSISRSLARALGGTLDFVLPESDSEQADDSGKAAIGSAFLLKLPIGGADNRLSEDEPPRTSSHRPVSSPVVGGWKSHRILIAEDTRANQFLLRRLLEPFGPTLVLVDDGKEALDAIASDPEPFDIVLMDMHMPNVDGYEATRILRQADYRGVIIAITAAAMAGDAQKCLTVGCDDYVTKPFHRRSLLQKIERFLHLSER